MIEEMSPAEFVRRRDAGEDLRLRDVREPHELAIAAIAGAMHIAMGEIPERLGELEPARKTVVLCRSGGRSLQVARFLEQNGFRHVANLSGGILRWGQDVDPSLQAY